MSCPKNIKKWLCFRWEGLHVVHYNNIYKNHYGRKWTCVTSCSLCGSYWFYESSHEDMVRDGLINADGELIWKSEALHD